MRTKHIEGLALLMACALPQRRHMALISYAAHVDAMSGKVGNLVATKSKVGQTVRKRVIPSNPRTAAQVKARQNLSAASKAFSQLTPAQRTSWDQYASTVMSKNRLTGAATKLSAISAFTQVSTVFKELNPAAAIPLNPPAGPLVSDAITYVAAGAPGDITITASGPDSANITTEILLVKLPSANRRPSPGQYRHNQFHQFVAGALTITLPLAKGFYAVAVRQADTTDGNQGQMVEIGIVTVT